MLDSKALMVFGRDLLWWFGSVVTILHRADPTIYRAWASCHECWVLQLMLMYAQVIPMIFFALNYRNGSIFHRQSQNDLFHLFHHFGNNECSFISLRMYWWKKKSFLTWLHHIKFHFSFQHTVLINLRSFTCTTCTASLNFIYVVNRNKL